MSTTRTRLVVPSIGQEFSFPGTSLTADQVRNAYQADIPGLANMTVTETTEGTDRVLTFTPRTGSKG